MTIKEFELKEKLRKVKNNDYVLEEGEDYFHLAMEMLNSIGSLDSELRDRLIYSCLYKWITGDRFTSEQLKELLEVSMSTSHLSYKLYEEDEDAVFKRTFSALVIALIVYKHRNEVFLQEAELQEVKNRLVEYMLNEEDLRGYVEVKGWAHSVAHTADALDELVQCNEFNSKDLLEILNSIKAKACIGHYSYVDEEEERMVNAVESALNRKILSDFEIIDWLHGFTYEYAELNYIHKYHAKVNKRKFLRSLYLRIIDREDLMKVAQEVKALIGSV